MREINLGEDGGNGDSRKFRLRNLFHRGRRNKGKETGRREEDGTKLQSRKRRLYIFPVSETSSGLVVV